MTRAPRSAKTLEELRGYIGDIIDIAAFSDAQMTQAVLSRVNGGATLKQLLTAAVSVARGRENSRIAEFERELEDAEFDRDELETTLQQIRDTLAKQTGGQS